MIHRNATGFAILPTRTANLVRAIGRKVLVLFVILSALLSASPVLRAEEAAPPAAAEDPAGASFRELRNLSRENPAKAVEGFRDLLVKYPDSEWADDAQYYLAMSLEKTNARRGDILAAYQTLVDKYPGSEYRDDALFAIADVWGRRARRAEDFNQAIKAYVFFIDNCPRSERLSEAKLRVGEIYLRLNSFEKAAGYFRRVMDEHPKSSFVTDACMGLASADLSLNRPQDALAVYSRVLETGLPDSQRLTVRLGMVDCYLAQKDGLEKALATCGEIRDEARQKKSMEDFAEYKTREKMASYYIHETKYKEAEGEYQAYIARFAKSDGVSQAMLNIGTIRLEAGKPAEAREMFQGVSSKSAVPIEKAAMVVQQAVFLEALAFEVEKKPADALRLYRKLVESVPRSYYGREARSHIEKLEKEAEKPPQPEKK
jgi:TolA-binding protein